MAGIFRRVLSSTSHHSHRFGVYKMSSQSIIINEFIGNTDHHCGVHIDSTKEPCDVNNIVTCLRASLEKWKKEEKKTIWFKIERKNSDWIPHLINEGFYFHHAKKEFVTLYRLLDSNYDIPPYAHTNVGVGAFVLNELTNEVLVIKEKHSSLPVSRWKLPGGYVEPGENIIEAAERELFEETGISGKFKSLVGFRHAHNYAFGCSDIYMVARLSPVTFDIKKCDKEVSECVWMKLEEYANHPEVFEQNRLIARKMIEYIKKNFEIGLVNGQRPNSTEPVWIYLINDKNEPTPTKI